MRRWWNDSGKVILHSNIYDKHRTTRAPDRDRMPATSASVPGRAAVQGSQRADGLRGRPPRPAHPGPVSRRMVEPRHIRLRIAPVVPG
jgi:hypothetical protein